jgi:hypothetical protein
MESLPNEDEITQTRLGFFGGKLRDHDSSQYLKYLGKEAPWNPCSNLNRPLISDQPLANSFKRIAPCGLNVYNPHHEKSLLLHSGPGKRALLTLLPQRVALELLLNSEFFACENSEPRIELSTQND